MKKWNSFFGLLMMIVFLTGCSSTTSVLTTSAPIATTSAITTTQTITSSSTSTTPLTTQVTSSQMTSTTQTTTGLPTTTTQTTTTAPMDQALVLHTSLNWKDVNYVYSLAKGNFPLSEIVYNKFAAYEPLLTLDVSSEELVDFTKLVIQVRGSYHLKVSIRSMDQQGVISTIYGIMILSEHSEKYELDISGTALASFREGIYQVSLTITPFANRHFGTFYIDYFAFEKGEMDSTVINFAPFVPVIHSYTQASESFDANRGWYNLDYVYSILTQIAFNRIQYSKLSGQGSSFIETKLSGNFSDFTYINIRIQGIEGKTIKFVVNPSQKLVGDSVVEMNVVMTGEQQVVTLYLDGLSTTARNSIQSVRIIAEPDSIASAVGYFDLYMVEFSNIALADRPEETVNKYLGGGQPFDFNHYWNGFNGLNAQFIRLPNQSLQVNYTKIAAQGLVFTSLEGTFSDFNYLNFEIQANPFEEFLITFNNLYSYRSDQQVRADSTGNLKVTMTLGLLYFNADKNAIDMVRISPLPNVETVTSSFIIKKAEFSNIPLVNYTPKTTIEFDDWMQIGNIFTMESSSKTISWSAQAGTTRLSARMNGDYTVSGASFLYPAMEVRIVSDIERTISFQVDRAIYQIALSPSKEVYEIFLQTPTFGTADYWKFSSGFNLWFDIDTTQAGSIQVLSVQWKSITPVVADTFDFIQKPFLTFNGATASSSFINGEVVVSSFTKSAFNSLLYFNLSNLGGIVLSDFDFLNLVIESDNVTEFIIELSGRNVMMHHVKVVNGKVELTMSLSTLLLPSSLNSLQYINITPMPNSNNATGSFKITKAEFSSQPMIDYPTKTQVLMEDWMQIGSNFVINTSTNQITWASMTGSKALYTRMYGQYSNQMTLSLHITTTQNVIMEFDIVGARYRITATPNQQEYLITLLTPTTGNADPWKFETGFNLYMWITTEVGGSIIINSINVITP